VPRSLEANVKVYLSDMDTNVHLIMLSLKARLNNHKI